jgi:hypothetical protein
MPISDPAQILQRVPELNELTGDPKILRAIESGDTFKLYRTLMLARVFRRLPEHAETLKLLTRERRLFAKPLEKMPSLGNINSVGFGFVGKAERDIDGSHIALHAFVVLYELPLVPLGAYVVQSTGDHEWQVYARAPLGFAGWLYTRGLAAALALLVGWGALTSIAASRSQDLVVLNGFGVPLTVVFDQQTVQVPANGRATIEVKAGPVHGVASTAKGVKVDSLDRTIVSSSATSIWNIAAAAPLFENTVVYTREGSEPKKELARYVVHCGKQFIEFEDIDFLFTEPPATMSFSENATHTTRSQVDVARHPGADGMALCLNHAIDQNQEAGMLAALEAQAELKGWAYQYAAAAVFVAQAVSDSESVRVAMRAAAASPNDIDIARLLQDTRDLAGEGASLIGEHRRLSQKFPDSAREQYLFVKTLHGRVGLIANEAVLAKFPDDPQLLRSLAWRRAAHGDHAGAITAFARLHAVSEQVAGYMIEEEVRTLVALQRGPDALKLLTTALEGKTAAARTNTAAEHALVARLLGADPEQFLRTNFDGSGDVQGLDLARVRAGFEPLDPNSATSPLLKIALALRTDPEAALALAAGSGRFALRALATDQAILLYGEAIRTGRKEVSAKLAPALNISLVHRQLLDQYMRGENVSIAEADISGDERAAAHFIRSRNASVAPAERATLRAQAANRDTLKGIISTAITQWKEAQ